MAILIVVAQSSSWSGGLVVGATLVFVVFFALGPGSIPWMIAGEMFTQGPRPAASALVVGVNWAANLLVSLLFGGFFLFIYLYLPETKGQTVGETTALLQK